jgi:hypothetical protein
MNGYTLIREWYNYKFEHPSTVKAIHSDFYCFLVDRWNRLGQKEEFGLPTFVTMELLGIGSYNTYKKTLYDLVAFGFVKIVTESKNQYQSRVIALSKIDEALDKALDKAHDKPTDEAPIKASDEASDNIIEQQNNQTIKQQNNKQITYRAFDHLVLTMEEFSEINLMYTKDEIDHILDSIENYKNNKKYKSLKMTALVWLRKEHGKREVIQTTPSGLRPAPIQSVI